MNNWIALVLMSSLITASSSVLDKRLMDGRSAHPFACTVSFGIVGLPVAVAGLVVLPPMPWLEALMAFAAGVLFVGAAWLYYDTVSKEDVSRLAPLLRLSSVQTLLLAAVFLGESLTTRQQMAFGVMLVSSVLLSLKSNDSGDLAFSRAALRMIPVTTLLAINGILMAYVYRMTSVWHGEVWEDMGIVIGLILIGGVALLRRRLIWRATDRRTWSVLIVEQVSRLVTGLVSALAVANGVPVALLSALGGVQLVWVWLLAILLLCERVERKELLFKGGGILGMALGVYWLM